MNVYKLIYAEYESSDIYYLTHPEKKTAKQFENDCLLISTLAGVEEIKTEMKEAKEYILDKSMHMLHDDLFDRCTCSFYRTNLKKVIASFGYSIITPIHTQSYRESMHITELIQDNKSNLPEKFLNEFAELELKMKALNEKRVELLKSEGFVVSEYEEDHTSEKAMYVKPRYI
jgi:hypothetical protein